MEHARGKEEKPGATVVLTRVPPGFLDDLPADDQKAICEIVGKPVQLVEYDADGRAELKFTDAEGTIHFIYVQPAFLRAAG